MRLNFRPIHAAALAVLLLSLSSGVPALAQEKGPIHYLCASGRQVVVVYVEGAQPGARLHLGERLFHLYAVRAASGARYATEQGLKPDHGLQWWTKGREATLSEMILDDTAPPAKVIDTCHTVRPPR